MRIKPVFIRDSRFFKSMEFHIGTCYTIYQNHKNYRKKEGIAMDGSEQNPEKPEEGAEGMDTEKDIGQDTEQDIQMLPHAQRDTGFYKVFLEEFTHCIEKIGNKKIKIFCWVINNIGRDNRFSYTYRQIAAKTNTSYSVVAGTMRTLLDIDFFRKEGKVLMINPDILFKGTYRRRNIIRGQYDRADLECNGMSVQEEMERARRHLRTLKRNVCTQQKQIEKLERFINQIGRAHV